MRRGKEERENRGEQRRRRGAGKSGREETNRQRKSAIAEGEGKDQHLGAGKIAYREATGRRNSVVGGFNKEWRNGKRGMGNLLGKRNTTQGRMWKKR